MTKVEKEVIQFLDKNGPSSPRLVEAKLMQELRFKNREKRRTRVRVAIQSLIMKTVVIINDDLKMELRKTK